MVDSHPVLLRGVRATSSEPGPLILKRGDRDFVTTLLDELADANGVDSVVTTKAKTANTSGVLTLFQPVHRAVHVALLEMVCDRAGEPRVDPQRIVEAGLVLRRVAVATNGSSTHDIGPLASTFATA